MKKSSIIMDQINELDKINEILSGMIHIIETKPYDKRQLIDFKDLIKKVQDIQDKNLFNTCYNNRGIDLICMICKHNKKKLLRCLLHESHILHYFTIENKNAELKYREDMLYHAVCSNQFKVIEMLYDHWTGDLHWLGHKKEYNDFDVDNMNQLKNLLKMALHRYENWTLSKVNRKIDLTMMFNIQSLIALSEFQSDLYTKLNEQKNNLIALEGEPVDIIRLTETYAIKSMFLNMFNCYDEHTNRLGSMIQKTVYKSPNEFSELDMFLESPKDTSELLRKTYLYVFFEVYFRKLDYNVCLLILDNLHSLKLRLIMPGDSYQKLENKVFHFMRHLSSKWSLYIPKKRSMKTKTFSGQQNNIDCFFSVKYNEYTFQKGLHIIYLERRDFECALQVFKNELQKINIDESMRKDKVELTNEEINCLMDLPELRDIYSLKRMSQQIAQLYSIDSKYTRKYLCLLVERTLQVVGEFLKSTNETLHLQPTTEALVEVEISVEIVNDLKSLRDFLCHVKDGELFKRIEIETNNNYIFNTIITELKFIKKKIDEIILICKPLVEKALILNGLSLIEKRRIEMPRVVANDWFNLIKRVRLLPQNEPYCKLFYAPKGYADEFATEIIMLVEHSLQLNSKLISVTENIRNNLIRKFSIYKEIIKTSLQKIIEVKKNWQQIVKILNDEIPCITLSDYPNENDANRIKTYFKQVKLNDNLYRLVEDNKLFAHAEIHWKFIKKILQFIILKTGIKHDSSVEFDKVIREINNLNYNNNDVEKIILNYLSVIEAKLDTVSNMKYQNQCPEFIGIKELRRKLTMANFLIQEEKTYLIDILQNIKDNGNIKRKEKITKMIEKLNTDVSIPKTEYNNFIATINFDKKAQKNLMNLVMGYKRDPLHLWCLSKRIRLLKEITKEQSLDKLVSRFKLDKTFRVLLEVIVFDILAILECTKNKEIVKKSSKLLTEMNLRNFLIHGSPLLEIVGNVLDSNDLPTELIIKAHKLVEEERSINALCTLKDVDFDFTQINSNALSPEQHTLVFEFKKSLRWKDYLTLIPVLKQTSSKKQKNVTEADKNLLDAVNAKSSELVRKRIAEGGNVNFVDDCKHAIFHYAAINGSVDIMKILLNNGADVNIRSKHNLTALHYTSMNGFTEAVDFLLKNGADYLALDDAGRTPLYLAGQRKHVNVCRMLVQAMKNK